MTVDNATAILVDLGSRSYPIVVRPGLLSGIAAILPGLTGARRLLLVSHPLLMELHGKPVASDLVAAGYELSIANVPAGEKSKSLSMVSRLYQEMAAAGLDRHSCVLALGGGVIGDLAGFAAATWLRGIDVIQIPTTLLAMVDSAIGGKTGVNLPIGKNLVGAFHQPRAVLADPAVLATLPLRDIRSGMAEVVKSGIIADTSLFEFVEANATLCRSAEPAAMARCILASASCKARVVGADERESGLRAILNYGHTAGHAVERAAGYRRLRHGEAVSIGMIAAARVGVLLGITPAGAARSCGHRVAAEGSGGHRRRSAH
jgi:3-dehydroquinate synthase